MNKFVKICLFSLLLAFFCASCEHTDTIEELNIQSTTENPSNQPTTELVDSDYSITIDKIINPELIEETDFYKILEGDGHYYYYYIYDKDDNIVDEMGFYWRKPELSIIDNSIVKVQIQLGTGIRTTRTRYYDSNSGLLSEWYDGVYDELNDIIIYDGKNKLIIQNIFDKNIYYCEIGSFSNEITDSGEPFVDVEFIEDGTSIRVTYIAKDSNEITEIISLE